MSRIGTEHEKFGFEFGTLRPMKYEQIADLLNGIAERFDWEKVMEDDKIIGLKQVEHELGACKLCLKYSRMNSSWLHTIYSAT